MATDLVVQLGAKLDQFSSDMDQAGNIADSAIGRIESAFANLNPGFGGLSGLGVAATGAVGAIAGLLASLKSVNSELAKIGQAAEYLRTSTDEVQKLQFTGTTAGISGPDALENLQNVGRLLNDAQRNENSLTKLLDANNIAYKDRNNQLISINDLLSKGADLVKNAATPADQTVIARMLGLTQEWVPLLRQGGEAFQDIGDQAQAAGVIIDRQTIAKAQNFDEAWKQSSALLSAQFKSAIADVASYLDDLVDKANKFIDDLNKAYGTTAGSGQDRFNAVADALEVVSRDAAGAAQNLDQVNRVIERYQNSKTGGDPEILEQLLRIQAAAQAAADQLQRTNQQIQSTNFPNGVPLPGARPAAANAPSGNSTKIPARDTGSDAKDAFDRAQNQIIKRTADYNAQTAAIGENTQAKVKAKAVADLETAAQRAGIELTDEQREKIQALAQAEGVAAQATANRNQQLQQQNQLLQAIGDQGISILDGLRNKTLSASQALVQLSNAFINAAEKALLLGQGPLAGVFGTAAAAGSGGTGGLLGALFGFKATGGGVNANQPYIVGEKGPELFTPANSGSITPTDALRKSGGGISVTIQQTNSYSAGMQPEDVATIQSFIQQNNPVVINATIQAIRQGNRATSTFLNP